MVLADRFRPQRVCMEDQETGIAWATASIRVRVYLSSAERGKVQLLGEGDRPIDLAQAPT